MPGIRAGPELTAARSGALSRLEARVERVKLAGLLSRKSVQQAAVEFNAMCEGLANAELRDDTLRILSQGGEERAWREGLATLVPGFRTAGTDERQ